MIKQIDIRDRKSAENVLNIQIPSYKVEAEIIGSYDIPPLKDTVDTLLGCGETFFGYYQDEELCGVVSIKEENDEVDIYRLIVHPTHFRKGIAQRLLNFIVSSCEAGTIKVATGSKNTPAVHFYEKNGFEKVKEVIVGKGLALTYFEKKL
ncbi:acetyltransferase (GNAT) family protein [Ureibacillus xyleni]|uniref:Acetyltransferase (GNAT) family protein n=1 Tax=Ureibacillus xyleni TaxID=614648 RepID=A0A285SKE6_9BACL|nr:GNAT family N-acetyltransferase [Ureibacillus xyleni]SOC06448.1 acetyltransferase (GNAT) family protein [Ureibacillus xyleni]